MTRLRSTLGAAVITLLVTAGCGGGESEPAAETASVTVTPAAASASTPGSEAPDTQPPPDATPPGPTHDIEALLAQDPLVIFNAYPPKPDHITYALPPGQRDFEELWEPDAPWQTALEHVDIYRLHAFQMRHFLDDEQLITLIDFLRERKIPLMLETEPLVPPDPDECAHTESYEAPWDLEMAVRLKELGGHVDMIAIEEPYHFGHLLDTPDACQYPVERVVEEVLDHVTNLRELFGDIPVGTIEPIWSNPRTEPDDLAIWLDTFEAIAGEPFAFLHVDPDWYRPDWADVAAGIEAVADARGVPFGVLYNGGVETDGLSWMNFMMANAAELELGHGATPQHVSFQSWVDWPDHALPDDDLSALTSGIVRYFGQRIELSVEIVDGALVGRVTDLDGGPVAGVPLEVRRTSGRQDSATQTVRGVVPVGISEALVLVRANAEDATPGEVAATLHEISFDDGSGGPNLVPNGDFAGGVDGWGVYGSHPDGVRAEAVASGPALALTAARDQDIYIDGTTFPVTPGSDYEFSVTYGLDGGSPDSVVVSVAFVGVTRANAFLHATPEVVAELVTDVDGRVELSADVVGGGPANITVTSPGTLDQWPVEASVSLNG